MLKKHIDARKAVIFKFYRLSGSGDPLALLRFLGTRLELRRIRQHPQSDRYVQETDRPDPKPQFNIGGMISGCLAGGHLFSCLVVFQFRKNLIEDAAIREAIQGQHASNSRDLRDTLVYCQLDKYVFSTWRTIKEKMILTHHTIHTLLPTVHMTSQK